MTITKVIFFPKPAQLILSHLSKQFHSSSYSEEDLFSFSHIPYPSGNHMSFLAALILYLPHLYTLAQASIILFLDHCSDLLSPASTLAPLQFRLHIVMLLKHEARYQSFTQNMPAYSKIQYRACDTLHNPAPGYLSDLICILITHSAVVASIYSSVPQICQVHYILRPLHF